MRHGQPLLIAILLSLAIICVFWKVPKQEFVAWDDNILVYNNPYLNPVTVSNVAHFWQHPYLQLYMPLTYSAWAALAKASRQPTPREVEGVGYTDLDAHPFHTVNLILHLLNVLLVFVILRKLVENDWAAAAGALLFGIHPVQVESVAWISELKGVFSGFFSLLALWLYLCFAQIDKEGSPSEGAISKDASRLRQGLYYTAALLCFVLALLCKPAAVSVPLMMWAIDRWLLQRPLRRFYFALLPWIAIAVLWGLFARRAQPYADYVEQPLWWRPFIMGDALAFYAGKIVWPQQLGIDYGRTPEWVMKQPWTYVMWLMPATVAVLIWWRRKQMPWLLASAVVLLAAVLPVSGLIPFNFQQYSTVADRYLYMGLLGPAIALAWLLAHVKRGKIAAGMCLLLLCGLGFRSMRQILTWNSSFALYENAVAVNPRSWVSHHNYADALDEKGDSNGAIIHLNEALRLRPGYALARTSMARILARQGQLESAKAQLQEALRLQPEDQVKTEAHNNIGAILILQGKTTEAVGHFRETLKLQPDNIVAHYNLGQILVFKGQTEQGLAHLREAVRIDPNNGAAREALAEAQQKLNESKSTQPILRHRP